MSLKMRHPRHKFQRGLAASDPLSRILVRRFPWTCSVLPSSTSACGRVQSCLFGLEISFQSSQRYSNQAYTVDFPQPHLLWLLGWCECVCAEGEQRSTQRNGGIWMRRVCVTPEMSVHGCSQKYLKLYWNNKEQ